MSLYEKYFLPKLLDCCCGMEGFQKKRAQVIPRVSGRVLEIGIGSGLNFDFYDFEKVTEVVGVDPAVSLVAIAKSRASILHQNHTKKSFRGRVSESKDGSQPHLFTESFHFFLGRFIWFLRCRPENCRQEFHVPHGIEEESLVG